ncbi:kinase-like protein [Xylaria bambusicola]|uniref:kinase-like protein n=1 Tax=Xylaria bambusicola TaxID=326684 RepID=UPI002007C368|nr:kinase-like protein [Xylaria bambusicola]KAI0520745.1 kinase-like protein [Xylaria bambusicola]
MSLLKGSFLPISPTKSSTHITYRIGEEEKPMISTSMSIANELRPRAFFQHLSENYKNEEWEFEKRLGFGAFGFTALLRRKASSGQPVQRMALKFMVGSSKSRVSALQGEISMLKRVNGASHIVSILASCVNLTLPTGNQYSPDNDPQTEASGVFEGFVGLVGPAVALEYLEYDLLASLCIQARSERTRLTGADAPNAVIRASVGLAYPPNQPIGSNTEILEELPNGHSPETESFLAHNDFNARNIMLTVGDGPEHGIGVKAKLIDLGFAEVVTHRRNGTPVNIFDAALTICCLATPNVGLSKSKCTYQGLPTKAVNLVGTGNPPFPLPWLDPELRDILARCMYEDPLQRPGLQEVLQVAQNAVHSKIAMSFPMPEMETESAVSVFVQGLIFNIL